MQALLIAIALLAAAACAGSEPAASSPPPPADPASESKAAEPAAEPPPPPAEPACGDKTCVAPEQCIRYYGIAGPKVPLFTCGIPCDEQGACPDGKSCAVIADGPRLCK